jgi:hypothetical protein
MVSNASREFFVTVAQASAGLTGLLFVALSVSRESTPPDLVVVRQVRAAAALFTFTSVLSVSLFALIRNDNVGYPALVAGIIGVSFVAAGARSIRDSSRSPRQLRRQLGLMTILIVTFGCEIVFGIWLIANSHNRDAMDDLQYVLATSLLIGIARSWGLAGERDTGLFNSLSVLTGRRKVVRHDSSETEATDGKSSPSS